MTKKIIKRALTDPGSDRADAVFSQQPELHIEVVVLAVVPPLDDVGAEEGVAMQQVPSRRQDAQPAEVVWGLLVLTRLDSHPSLYLEQGFGSFSYLAPCLYPGYTSVDSILSRFWLF